MLSHRPRNINFNLRFDNGILYVICADSLYLSKEAVNKLDPIEGLKVSF